MKTMTIVEIYTRDAPRAPLHQRLYWFGEIKPSDMWTLVAEIRGILGRRPTGAFGYHDVTQEAEERSRTQKEAPRGDL